MHKEQVTYNIEFPEEKTIKGLLGIATDVPTQVEEMAHTLTGVTFFPKEGKHVTAKMREFSQRLEGSMKDLGVKVVPFESVHFTLPFSYNFV